MHDAAHASECMVILFYSFFVSVCELTVKVGQERRAPEKTM